MLKYFILSCNLLVLLACQAQEQSNSNGPVYLIEGDLAKYHITQDLEEGFFSKINQTEAALQMKAKPTSKHNDTDWQEAYQAYLRADVLDFKASEKEFVQGVFDALYQNPKLEQLQMPDSILLIKVAGRHYGNSVYYTRENCIIIPQNVLAEADSSAFSGVMLHELFHIYSRYNPSKRKALYETVGFEKTTGINVPTNIANRMVYNPDGLDIDWTCELETTNGTTRVIPLLVSVPTPAFNKGLFANFQFQLYEVQAFDDGSYTILSDSIGNSTLSMSTFIPAYYKLIGTNTDYIIHPDEILADHFMMIMRADTTNLRQEAFEGYNLDLRNRIEHILFP